MKLIPLILAGGSGTRFWPLSRKSSPKHVLNIDGNNTMVGEAVARFGDLAQHGDIHVVTSREQYGMLQKAIGKESAVRFIFEPMQRGTSACILLSAMQIIREYGDCVICVSPSDHYITLPDQFEKAIRNACDCAEQRNKIVTIGITPTFPSTGYGYICCDFDTKEGAAYKVNEFVEKPPFNKARQYVSAGNYFWNSGIFVFKASVILESFQRFLPRIYDKLSVWNNAADTDKENALLDKIYAEVQNISIDYGIMERSDDLFIVPSNMGWNDIGSWDALGCIYPPDNNGNIKLAKSVSIDTKNCVLFSDKSLIATIGIENMIIVDCPDALLVCPKSEAQRVKNIVEYLKKNDMESYL